MSLLDAESIVLSLVMLQLCSCILPRCLRSWPNDNHRRRKLTAGCICSHSIRKEGKDNEHIQRSDRHLGACCAAFVRRHRVFDGKSLTWVATSSHNYAWQVSADTFYVLASWLQDTDSRNLCLLNAAMIQARLGDSHIAADTLRKVNANGDLHLFEMFVSGIVNCELGDAARAEACFETCLDGLSDHSIEYAVPAMTFTLSSSVVKDNLIALREAQFAAILEGTSFTALNGVPADYIFEAPVSWPSQDTSGESSEIMRDLPTLKTVVAGSANVDRTETGHTAGQNKAIPRSVPL